MSIDAALQAGERADSRRSRAPLVAFLLLWVLWGSLLVGVRVQHPGLSVGEDWGDADILNAGRFFDRFGYGPTAGLPRLDTAPLLPGEAPVTYNSFPPGPFWIHQGIKALGITDLAAQRALHQVYTHLGELLFFLVVRWFTGSGWLALLAACLHMFSIPYASYSSGLWVNMGQTTFFGALYAWARYEAEPAGTGRLSRASAWLSLAAALAFVNFWITFEEGVFLAVVVGVRGLFTRRWRTIAAAALVASMPPLVMAMRTLYTALAKDVGLVEAVHHFVAAGEARSGMGHAHATWPAVLTVWLTRLGWPWSADPNAWHNRVFMYPVLWPAVLAPALLLLGSLTSHLGDERLAAARRGFWNAMLFLLGGLTWTVLMRGHVWHHRFTVLTLMPGLALLLGTLVYTGWQLRPRRGTAERRRPLMWLPAVAGAAIMIALPMSLRYSDLLNHEFTLDPARARRSRESESTAALHAAAGQALGGVERAVVFPKRPMISYELDIPFVHAGATPPTGRPDAAAGEAWVLDTWAPDAGKLAARLSGEIGLPDVQREPGRLVVFPARVGEGAGVTQPITAEIEGFGRIEAVRIAPTLDGGSIAVLFRVSGRLRPVADRFVFGVILLDADGREIGKSGSRLSWTRCFDRGAGFVWVTLPREKWDEAARVRLSVWDTRHGRAALWTIARDLPESATLLQDRRGVEVLTAQQLPTTPQSTPAPAEQPPAPVPAR